MTFIRPRDPLTSAFGEALVAQLEDKIHVQFAYNLLHPEQVTTEVVGTGTVTSTGREAVVSTGTGSTGTAQLRTVRTLRYLTGKGAEIRFAGRYTTGVVNSYQEIGYGDDNDGFFFGYKDAVFGVWRRKSTVDVFVAQANWNVDVMDGTGPSGQTLDQTKSCVYALTFQWLGAGSIKFYVEAVGGADFTLVHVMEYAGLFQTPHIDNPTLPIHVHVENSGNTTDLVVSVSSMAGFSQGVDFDPGLPRSYDQARTAITTEVAIMSIRNRATFNSLINRVPIHIDSAGAGVYDNQASTLTMLRLYKGATLGGTPSWANFSTLQSVAEIDVSATTVTGGVQIASLPFGPNSDDTRSLDSRNIEVMPGEWITLTAQSTGTLSNIWVTIDWKELF